MSIARLTYTRPQAAAPSGAPAQPATPPGVVTRGGEHRRGELITPAQAANLLRVQVKVLERWRGTGEGPAYVRLSSKTIRYRHEDVDTFVAGRVRASTAA